MNKLIQKEPVFSETTLNHIATWSQDDKNAYENLMNGYLYDVQDYIQHELGAKDINIIDFLKQTYYHEVGIFKYWIHIYNCEEHGFIFDPLITFIDSYMFNPLNYIREYEIDSKSGKEIFKGPQYIELAYLAKNKARYLVKPDYFRKNKVAIKTYVMIDARTKYYKIGKSKDPFYRERTLQSQVPDIKTLIIIEANVEKELHKKYSDKRLRGEWFDLSQQDLLQIKNDYKCLIKNK